MCPKLLPDARGRVSLQKVSGTARQGRVHSSPQGREARRPSPLRRPSCGVATMEAMPVGVVDVGSNTVRLLVTRRGRPVLSLREMLRLGADVERHGRIPVEKLELTARVVGGYADAARAEGVEQLEVLITSPGRQAANGAELLEYLARAARCNVRVLSAVEEGRLAFVGAVGFASPPPRRRVAVVDVGGGSAQVVVGTRRDGPAWVRSIDLGSQRLTSRLLSADPPGDDAIEAARIEVERYLTDLVPPAPRTSYAVGGSARALKRIVGPQLGGDELAEAIAVLASTRADRLARKYDIDEGRTRTLAAGAVILSALQQRLDSPLKVVRGGLRDGAVAELAARSLAA
jgi:exopolyphosphatase / guanosine-5'-triphosphate,3'-diphosphate pyrophosphatase